MELLFSYGTLQQENVQIANFGRVLKGNSDVLPCYNITKIKISDKKVLDLSRQEFHPILKYTGDNNDEVSGTIFELTKSEIKRADDYEVDDYKRVRARLKSGRGCWVYAATK